MKAIVSGGRGFVGSHLVDDLLAAGVETAVIDDGSRGRFAWADANRQPNLFEVSILDQDALGAVLGAFQPDVVYHLAAEHFIPACEAAPQATFELNLMGTINVVEAARSAGNVKKFYFASTGDVYGRTPLANNEAEPTNPSSVYGESKLMGEMVLRRYWQNYDAPFDVTIGRMFNAAGTRETNPHLLPSVVAQVTDGKETIEVGNLWPLRDFVEVTSMARAIRELTESTQGFDVVNVGSGRPISVGQALEMLAAEAPNPLRVVSVPEKQRPNDRAFLAPDVGRLRSRLGWTCDGFSVATARAIWAEAAHQSAVSSPSTD